MTYVAEEGRLRGRTVMACDRIGCGARYAPTAPNSAGAFERARRRGWRWVQVGISDVAVDLCSAACGRLWFEVYRDGAVVAGELGT